MGSFLVAQLFMPLPPSAYFGNLLEIFKFQDLIISLVKSIGFGIIVSTVAIGRGFDVSRASTEVPIAGLKAVGSAFGGCILLDVLLSALYYMVAGF
jgi:phospholipid/cholesterol/gamma-HCH transport system permease protein